LLLLAGWQRHPGVGKMFGNQAENSYSGLSLEFISHPCTCHELGGGEGASIEITHFPFFFSSPTRQSDKLLPLLPLLQIPWNQLRLGRI
jgi:hypothetical protein